MALPGRRVMLKVRDDGHDIEDGDDKQGLGTQILQGLADQIHGTLAITLGQGTTVTVDFPTASANSGRFHAKSP